MMLSFLILLAEIPALAVSVLSDPARNLWTCPILQTWSPMKFGTMSVLPELGYDSRTVSRIIENRLVSHAVLVPDQVLLTHIHRQRTDHRCLLLSVRLACDQVNDTFDIPSVMCGTDWFFLDRDNFRTGFPLLRRRSRER